jgi:hypothetical protein
MDVLPSYALPSVARNVLLPWVIQKGRVQDMDLQQQTCIGSGVPKLSPFCKIPWSSRCCYSVGRMESWHGIPEGAFILQLDTSSNLACAWQLGSAASTLLF